MPEELTASGAAGLACAKINLTLHVTGRQEDGYHRLQSLVVFASIADRITAHPASAQSLTIGGPMAPDLIPVRSDNLVLRAADAFLRAAGLDVSYRFHLEKTLPVASGIGGGSADAAAVLRVLSQLHPGLVSSEALEELALGLGADVPVCLASRSAVMSGIGEIVSPAPALPPLGLVLVNPGVSVPTPAVFKALTRRSNPPMPDLPDRIQTLAQLAGLLERTRNDLEAPAVAVCQQISEVLSALAADRDIAFARMSGSGATCFGLCAREDAADIAVRLRAAHPAWWVAGGEIV
ncbi:4-diphosphocytidyl-2-C-methyl-D-erythritol kinase [Roseibium aquae]|uniref:4-diphosphocytidyl-2-C-methyl-D-erythritol kinase n=1 Tax=Roseibium aquae TaxID=1323746 RepID=A0A916TM41_9HYPH|nr:4-(cytidine 5'-diphospho)-2-C-methyl-D-erythritol kinase [Roseibium aquae]GGB59340.1 4-diphosphocytidyl-2-C-methyl-D-erythritol kinase [Roseibium aquae]